MSDPLEMFSPEMESTDLNALTRVQLVLDLAVAHQADHVGVIAAQKIPFEESLRASCVQNYCGHFNTSWMGPPAIGEVRELRESVRRFQSGIVIQTVDQLEDSFDYEGMVAAKARHQAIFRRIWSEARERLASDDGMADKLSTSGLIALDVGCCHICGKCTYPDEPCCNPDEALASVEAYGIHVSQLLTACGLKYNNGKDTVSYVGLILV